MSKRWNATLHLQSASRLDAHQELPGGEDDAAAPTATSQSGLIDGPGPAHGGPTQTICQVPLRLERGWVERPRGDRAAKSAGQ
jgi:hypothetical protein